MSTPALPNPLPISRETNDIIEADDIDNIAEAVNAITGYIPANLLVTVVDNGDGTVTFVQGV